MNVMSDVVFTWMLTAFVGVISVTWFVLDSIALARMWRVDARDPLVADRRFGYIIGVVITAIGIIGTLRYHHVI